MALTIKFVLFKGVSVFMEKMFPEWLAVLITATLLGIIAEVNFLYIHRYVHRLVIYIYVLCLISHLKNFDLRLSLKPCALDMV